MAMSIRITADMFATCERAPGVYDLWDLITTFCDVTETESREMWQAYIDTLDAQSAQSMNNRVVYFRDRPCSRLDFSCYFLIKGLKKHQGLHANNLIVSAAMALAAFISDEKVLADQTPPVDENAAEATENEGLPVSTCTTAAPVLVPTSKAVNYALRAWNETVSMYLYTVSFMPLIEKKNICQPMYNFIRRCWCRHVLEYTITRLNANGIPCVDNSTLTPELKSSINTILESESVVERIRSMKMMV